MGNIIFCTFVLHTQLEMYASYDYEYKTFKWNDEGAVIQCIFISGYNLIYEEFLRIFSSYLDHEFAFPLSLHPCAHRTGSHTLLLTAR